MWRCLGRPKHGQAPWLRRAVEEQDAVDALPRGHSAEALKDRSGALEVDAADRGGQEQLVHVCHHKELCRWNCDEGQIRSRWKMLADGTGTGMILDLAEVVSNQSQTFDVDRAVTW